MTEKTDRNGRETAYTYDAAGRLTSEVWLGANDAAVKTFTYTYDTLGRLLTVGDGVSNYVYSYDTMNRVDTITLTFDGQTAVFDYSYDSVGRQTQSALTLNNVADRIVDTEYDYLGRAVSVQMKDSPTATDAIFAEFESNALGLVSEMRRYEQENDDITLVAKSVLQYNAANQLTNITHKDASNNTLVSHGYTFDAAGNISQYANSIDGTVTYDYDFLGQLIDADYQGGGGFQPPEESYSYDANGNRTLTGYVTGDNNELSSDGSWNYDYDAEGNRISKTNSTSTERELYEWDYRNRLTTVTKQEWDSVEESWTTVQIVEYAYDYNNVLIRKMIDTDGKGAMDSKTLFLPENYQTAVQLDDSDLSDSTGPTVSHRYLWTPGQQDNLIADEQVTASGSNVLWSLTDHLGTVRDIIQQTPSGIITKAHIIYDAYGNVLSCKDSNGTDIASPVIFGYTGKYFDANTKLQNNVNRWYDATTGRWLSTDPIGFEGNDTNLYRYVGNNVTFYLDSFGLLTPVTKCMSLLGPYRTIMLEVIKKIPQIRAKGIDIDLEILYKSNIYNQNYPVVIVNESNLVDKINNMFGFYDRDKAKITEAISKINKKCGCSITVEFYATGVFYKRLSGGTPWYEFMYRYYSKVTIGSFSEERLILTGAIEYKPTR